MDDLQPTIKAAATRTDARAQNRAILVHIYPTGPEMGTRYVLADAPVTLGRGINCEVKINDNSVSRRHAEVKHTPTGYIVSDCGSTNGTYLNDHSIDSTPLTDGDYVRVGNNIFRFLAGGNVEAEYHEEIYRLTIIDALTQCYNKRYLHEFLERELARSVRHKRPLSVIMFDIDHFKRINDDHTHLAGDHVLRELAGVVRRMVRREELFARYGGEEFAFVMPETSGPDAAAAAERIRAAIEQATFTFDEESIAVTVSLGVSCTRGEIGTADDLLRAADEALYVAKRERRNCVRRHPSAN